MLDFSRGDKVIPCPKDGRAQRAVKWGNCLFIEDERWWINLY